MRSTSPPVFKPVRFVRRLRNKAIALQKLHNRERRRLREEIGRVPGLMALLMKPRNGIAWTREERVALRAQLWGMRRLSLYVALLVIPGTFITLPLIAWWLDRRHTRRLPISEEIQESKTE